jgi:hypothetical protein
MFFVFRQSPATYDPFSFFLLLKGKILAALLP